MVGTTLVSIYLRYAFDEEEYLMAELFPSLKIITICGTRVGGNDKNLIVPDGCEIVYKE